MTPEAIKKGDENISHRQKLMEIKLGIRPKEVVPKAKKPLKKVSDKKREEMASSPKVDKTELQKWYDVIMENEDGRCWETFEKINKNDKVGWHGSIAHVLPKDLFPSVATHPQNYMILSMWNGSHATYDSSWERAARMKIWPYAVKIINILYPLLTTEEKRKLPEVIIQEINPEVFNKS